MTKVDRLKYSTLISSLLLLTCLGSLYAWSSFVPELKATHGLSSYQTQLIFGFLIGIFTISMVFAGRRLERWGPTPFLFLCALFLLSGYGLAAFSGGNFLLLFIGISVFVGTATGLGYVTTMTTCMKWFSHHKGFITGIAMGAFGFGAILVANIARYLIASGTDVLQIFLLEGILYALLAFAATFWVRLPAAQATQESRQASDNVVPWKQAFFWALVTAMFCGTCGGLIVIGNLTEIVSDKGHSLTVGVWAVSMFSVGNALGRIFWGKLVDHMGQRVVVLSLVLLAFFIGCLIYPSNTSLSGALFDCTVAFLVGFCFGASFVIHAALTAFRFGVTRVGEVYSLIFLAYGAAGILGPPVSGLLRDLTASHYMAVIVAVGMVLFGCVCSVLLLSRHSQTGATRTGASS